MLHAPTFLVMTQIYCSSSQSRLIGNKLQKKQEVSLQLLRTPFGVSLVVCGAHLHLPCVVGLAATFAVNVELVAGYWQYRA